MWDQFNCWHTPKCITYAQATKIVIQELWRQLNLHRQQQVQRDKAEERQRRTREKRLKDFEGIV